jgi:hypothetical protein
VVAICKARPEGHRRAAISIHTLQRHSKGYFPQPTTPITLFLIDTLPATGCSTAVCNGYARFGAGRADSPDGVEALHMSYHFGENTAKTSHTNSGRWCCSAPSLCCYHLLSAEPRFSEKSRYDGIQCSFSGLADFSTSGQQPTNDDVAWWVQRYLLDVSRDSLGGEIRLRVDCNEMSPEIFSTWLCVRTSNDAIWGVWSGCGSPEEELYMRSPRTLKFDHSSSTQLFL